MKHVFPKGSVMHEACGFRGMRFPCVYVVALFLRHSGSAEGKSVLGDMAFPSFDGSSLAVLAIDPLPKL